jgi:hypothetical protein
MQAIEKNSILLSGRAFKQGDLIATFPRRSEGDELAEIALSAKKAKRAKEEGA